MSKFSLSVGFKVFDDETGSYIAIEEDPDGLGLCEIKADRVVVSLTCEQIPHVIHALIDFYNYYSENNELSKVGFVHKSQMPINNPD